MHSLDVGAAEIWTVLTVETRGCGFLPDRRPKILFERHVFSNETGGRFDRSHADISNKKAGGYGKGGAPQYERLARAMGLDRAAALRSASWGLAQVMGFNAGNAGFADVNDMVAQMTVHENVHLRAMVKFIQNKGIAKALRNHDWATFAFRYNGAGFKKNRYDIKLAAAFHQHSSGIVPDLIVRAAQMYLMYLDFDPGPVDGDMGTRTRSAMNEFQEANGLAATQDVDEALVEILRQHVPA